MANNNSKVSIRPAKSGDAAEIANVHLNAWREIYRGLLPQDFLDRLPLTFKRRMRWWQTAIESATDVLWVAEAESGLVGFSCLGKARDEALKELGELGAIYLLEAYKGQGIGYQLLKNGMNSLRDRGIKKVYCWVLENNPTIKFYEKTGARFNSMTKEDKIGGLPVKELAYQWDNLDHFEGSTNEGDQFTVAGRSPFQVLVIPFRRNNSSIEFCILKRSDAGYWQFVAGGGEANEEPFQAAKREAVEELGIQIGHIEKLDSFSSVPAKIFKSWESWPKGTLVIPEYVFAADIGGNEPILSTEHSEMKWCTYEKAIDNLHWQSNKNALWELNERLRNNSRSGVRND